MITTCGFVICFHHMCVFPVYKKNLIRKSEFACEIDYTFFEQ